MIAFLLTSLTFFMYGLDVSVFVFVESEVRQTWNLTEIQYALYPAITRVSNLIGAILISTLTDYYGRVWPYVLAMTVIGVFGLADSFSPSFSVLIILRGLASLGVGGIAVVALPMFVEFLPRKNRGSALILSNLTPSLALSVACGLAWWLIPTYPRNGWRYFMIVALTPAFLTAGFRLIFYFQSPRYLLGKQKYTEAWKVLKFMAWMNGKNLSSFVEESKFSPTVHTDKTTRPPLKDLVIIFKRPYLRRTLCLTGLIITEISGYIGSTLFLPQELTKLNVDKYFSTLVAFIAQVPGVLFMAIIIEWKYIGRLNSLRFFSVVAAVFFFLLAFIQTEVTIPVFLIFIYFSLLPILIAIYAYISETYPTNIRSLTVAYFSVIQALTSVGIPFISAYLVSLHHIWLYCTVWGCVYVLNLVFALLLNYEPRHRQLVDVLIN